MGPFIVSMCFQAYIYFGTMTLARTQAILTELVFEHSLRVRFKAESSGEGERTPAPATPAESVDNGSVEGSSSGDDNETQSVQTESTIAKGKAKEPASSSPAAPSADSKKKDNLVGKINTLVTVDVDNIVGSKDFLMLCKSLLIASLPDFRYLILYIVLQVPLELILAMTFLYVLLGWRYGSS